MNIAIVGTGGVGGYFGGLLAQAGHDVAFIARGAHLQAIQAHGLRIESLAGTFTITHAHATDNTSDIGPVDLVVVAVKSYDLAAAIEQMRPLVGPRTTVLTLQNGVEAPQLVATVFGTQSVLPGLVYCEVAIKAPGVIFQGTALSRIILGESDGSLSARALAVSNTFASTSAETVLSRNVLGALWTKFGFICAMGGVTTMTRSPLGAVLADTEGRILLQTVIQECQAVGQAQGVHFDHDPVAAGMETAARFPFEAKSSMQRDLERGNRLEVEALNGAVVRLGRTTNVTTPANQAIYTALRLAQPTIA